MSSTRHAHCCLGTSRNTTKKTWTYRMVKSPQNSHLKKRLMFFFSFFLHLFLIYAWRSISVALFETYPMNKLYELSLFFIIYLNFSFFFFSLSFLFCFCYYGSRLPDLSFTVWEIFSPSIALDAMQSLVKLLLLLLLSLMRKENIHIPIQQNQKIRKIT